MKQPIEHIRSVAPVPSILTSATPLPGSVNWSTGIAWTPAPCYGSTGAWPHCPPSIASIEASGNDKNTSGSSDSVATNPFSIYTPIECEWVTDEAGTRLEAFATELTDVRTAYQIARALWLGVGLDDVGDPKYGLPPTLRRSATDVSNALNGVAALDDVVAVLLSKYEICTGGLGGAVLHIPTVLIPGALGGGDGGARVAWPEGSIYRGPNGSVISPGPGYPHDSSLQGANGYGPLVSHGPPEVYKGNGYSEAWVYISGPVEYAVTPVAPPNTVEERRGDPRQNRYEVIAERRAIVRFDPCCVFAARALNTSGEVS